MKILVLAVIFGGLGIMPIVAYDKVVQPQMDSFKKMYGSMDQTAEDIASGKDLTQSDTYRYAKELSSGTGSQ